MREKNIYIHTKWIRLFLIIENRLKKFLYMKREITTVQKVTHQHLIFSHNILINIVSYYIVMEIIDTIFLLKLYIRSNSRLYLLNITLKNKL